MRLVLKCVLAASFAAAVAGAVPAMAEDLPTFTLELKDGVITPNRIEVLAKQAFKIIVINAGKGVAEFESLQLHKEKVMAPGAISFVVIRGLSPGKYEFFDDFHIGLQTAHGIIIAK